MQHRFDEDVFRQNPRLMVGIDVISWPHSGYDKVVFRIFSDHGIGVMQDIGVAIEISAAAVHTV